MYERNAAVLERYFNELFAFDKESNLKVNYENYKKIIEEIKEYQRILKEEEKEIEKFDEIANEIQVIQRKQEKLYLSNIELEKQRKEMFDDLEENPNNLSTKLQKIEQILEKNNEVQKELREEYVQAISIFFERQKERNKYTKSRRNAEANYMKSIEEANRVFTNIEIEDVKEIKSFLEIDLEEEKQDIINKMIKNGKNEKVKFYEEAIKQAVETRIDIAKKEAELYLSIYERIKRLLVELNNDNVKLGKSEKLLRDVTVKLNFLEAEKEYIVVFLDNERMTAITGEKLHKKMMKEACEKFRLDINQINNLYELLIRETVCKATKKAYSELYNKNYLKEMQEKEISFNEEANNIKLNMGTVINSNYWRIDGVKNIYNVFQEEVTEKFNKDLSEYKLEEITEEDIIEKDKMVDKNKEKSKNNNQKQEENREIIKRKIFDFGDETEEDFDDDFDNEDDEELEKCFDDDFDYIEEEEELNEDVDEEFDYDDDEEEIEEEFEDDSEYREEEDELDEDFEDDFDYGDDEEEIDEDIDDDFDYGDDEEEIDEDIDENFDYEKKHSKAKKDENKSSKIKTKENKKESGLLGKLFKNKK